MGSDLDIRPLVAWVNEREAIRLRKAMLENQYYSSKDADGPSRRVLSHWWDDGRWTLARLTDDPILHQYRFCNIRRQDDRVTRWLTHHISEPFATHRNLAMMLAIARQFNWPPTVQHLMDTGAWPTDHTFDPAQMTRALEPYQAAGNKVTTGSFMVRAESSKTAPWYSWSKVRYLSEIVLGRVWEKYDKFEGVLDGGPLHQPTLQEAWTFLTQPWFIGYGPFVAGQLVTDLRWTRYLSQAPDIQTWTALGPGSRKGLNRLHGRSPDAPLSQAQGLDEMLRIREAILKPGVLAPWVGDIDLSDIQNCLCEYSKYDKTLSGEGRPRARYVPGRGS